MKGFITQAGFEKTFKYWDMIQEGLIVTVLLSLFTVIIGFILGLFTLITK